MIGKPADAAAYQAYLAEAAKLDAADRAARQVIVDQLRAPESLAVYLELALAWPIPKIGTCPRPPASRSSAGGTGRKP